jgi:hypothetical protein
MNDNELIRLRAYEIWIREGQPEGRELEHWLQARREILGSPAEQRDENPVPGAPSNTSVEAPTEDAFSTEELPKGDELKEGTELG